MKEANSSHERTVVFGHVDEGRVEETMSRQSQRDNFKLGSIASGIPQLKTVDNYTTFKAEYALHDGNLVFHFYPPKSHSQRDVSSYWTQVFPTVLDRVAQEVFEATAPRLQAKYTVEFQSWWLRALSYDHLVDVQAFVTRFLDALDAGLDALV